MKVERDELVEELLKSYIQNNLWEKSVDEDSWTRSTVQRLWGSLAESDPARNYSPGS